MPRRWASGTKPGGWSRASSPTSPCSTPRATPLLAVRDALSEALADTLLALMILGDDRAVRASWVAGREWRPEQNGPAG